MIHYINIYEQETREEAERCPQAKTAVSSSFLRLIRFTFMMNR